MKTDTTTYPQSAEVAAEGVAHQYSVRNHHGHQLPLHIRQRRRNPLHHVFRDAAELQWGEGISNECARDQDLKWVM